MIVDDGTPDESERFRRAELDVLGLAAVVRSARRTSTLTTETLEDLDRAVERLDAARRELLRLPPPTTDDP